MRGSGPICLRLTNHQYYEHEGLDGAAREAHRLAEETHATVVVYVPVLRVDPPPQRRTVETLLVSHDDIARLQNLRESHDLPF